MTDYYPDRWVVIKIDYDDEVIYKVFGSWQGGFLNGDSWRMNSGVKSVSLDVDFLLFKGFSGSTYYCHKDSYGMTAYARGVMLGMKERAEGKITIMDEDVTDWLSLVEQKC